MSKDKDKDTTTEEPAAVAGALSATPSELAAQDVASNEPAPDDTSEDSASFFARMTLPYAHRRNRSSSCGRGWR